MEKRAMENTTADMYRKFVDEYDSDNGVQKYTSGTAGYGIGYLLTHDYARVYLEVVDSYLKASPSKPLRVLEFGCGGGMNIIHLIELLEKRGLPVGRAFGTDFLPRMVGAAEQQAKAFLPSRLAGILTFHTARNENLGQDLAQAIGSPVESLSSSFDLIIGVNTFRYCYRLKKDLDCARDIHRLLRPGGICVMIDMNTRFPAFRSRLNGSDQRDPVATYVPTLEEYATPFKTAGFEVLREENFCWIPHSAGRALTTCCRAMSPFLNLVARSRAMRSLVIARRSNLGIE
jgi:SAM-dependent methyltransferase